MRLATIRKDGLEQAAVQTARGIVTLEELNRSAGRSWPTGMLELIESGALADVRAWLAEGGQSILAGMPALAPGSYERAPLYRRPRKIWGIGFNYVQDAEELKTVDPAEEPVGFMKPDTSLIGPGEPIRLPADAGRINAEAELAIVIGRTCRNVSEAEASRYVAGFAATLDMTAADIHARNPRFLTRAKSFDTFFSLGSELVTPDELENVLDLTVHTALNGEVKHTNKVFNMRYRPWFAVAFHSRFMTLLPGDILMTGTPGAVQIRDGDTAECRIDGFEPLANPVRA
ncbi:MULTISPECIES: fumarylacetoacetate hydrolase family protein [Cohnella]|uniref:fumarylacetoacetate hydrolase family protein n=1 Tax=Cohnella TaxID=329857 RepID=UPI0009B9C912|nr:MULTISPECIES: fumarylacetoacetate hydrolase family protein [Cohnella]MBN2980366.1 fumarylacetoacetate hydrolase family protein [Cohnella algarum]